MAVFPDKIILKNSDDGDTYIRNVIDPSYGTNPIIPGEIVVSRLNGRFELYAVDKNNSLVKFGEDVYKAGITPEILLNFENTADDTDYTGGFTSTFPDTTTYKFGSKAATFNNTSSDQNQDILEIDKDEITAIGTKQWTLQFWIKGDVADWYGSTGFLSVIGAKYYIAGPGAWQIYLDAGTSDQPNGGGTSTSETSGQARGSVVLGINPGESNTHDFLPDTGEIVSTRATTVLDNAWHHVVIQHEGEGIYSAYVDGVLKQRKFHQEPIDFSNPGTTSISLPTDIRIGGGPSGIQGNTTILPGLNATLDAISFHNGIAIYKGLYGYTVPTSAPNDDAVAARDPFELRSLYDTDLDAYSSLANNSVIKWNSTAQAWQTADACPCDISGDSIGDLSDVNLEVYANIGDNEVLTWNVSQQKFINTPNTINNLGNVSLSSIANNQFLKYNGSNWVNHTLVYSDVGGRPTNVSDLNVDINVADLDDVTITTPISNGSVLVWNSTASAWENQAAPPANISSNSVFDLGNVDQAGVTLLEDHVLIYNTSTTKFEPGYIDYVDIAGRPTNVSDLTNDSGFLTDITNEDIGDLSDVTITSVANGHNLVYRDGAWKNEPGSAADISGNILDDLADVSCPSNGSNPRILEVEDVGEFRFDPLGQQAGFTRSIVSNAEYGVGISNLRTSDSTGSAVYVERGRGITMRSDMGRLHIQGRPGVGYTNNTPEIRIDSGDSGADTPTGYYVGFTIPSGLTESTDYVFPSEDGGVGHVLATDGSGNLSWVTQTSSGSINDLSDVDTATDSPDDGDFLKWNNTASNWVPTTISIDNLSDVDTSTTAPTDGQGLVWVSADSEWQPGDVAPDLSTLSIDELQDVDTTTTPPTSGKVLRWNGSTWVPGDAISNLNSFSIDGLSDVDTTTVAPTDGQTLIWSAANSEFRPGTAALPGAVTVSKTSASIAAAATGTFDKAVSNGAGLIHNVTSDVAGWLRIYETSAARTADIGRARNVDPTVSDGVILEVIFTAAGTFTITPKASYYTGTLYYTFTNDSSSAAAVTIGLTTVGLM
jgi:hypothetical protein